MACLLTLPSGSPPGPAQTYAFGLNMPTDNVLTGVTHFMPLTFNANLNKLYVAISDGASTAIYQYILGGAVITASATLYGKFLFYLGTKYNKALTSIHGNV